MEHKTFLKNLKTILDTGKQQQELIHACACYALEKVNIGKTVGQDSPIAHFWNTITQLKSVNRQAVMDWLNAYGFMYFAKGEGDSLVIKFKDKSAVMDAENAVELARETPFWEFAKDPEPDLSPFDVLKKLQQVIKSAKNAASGGAKGDKPARRLEHAELLDVINYVTANTESAMQKLGLSNRAEEKPAKETKGKEAPAVPVTGEYQGPERRELQIAAA